MHFHHSDALPITNRFQPFLLSMLKYTHQLTLRWARLRTIRRAVADVALIV